MKPKLTFMIRSTTNRVAVIFLFLGLSHCVLAEEAWFKNLNLGSRVVTNAYVASATPVEVMVLWDGGGKTFKRADLPPALKEHYLYDADKAAAFLKEQEVERETRLQQARLRQQRTNQDIKSTLLGQRLSMKERIAALEKELAKTHAQTDAARPRFRRRLTAGEIQDLERLTLRQRELRGQIVISRVEITHLFAGSKSPAPEARLS